VPSAPGPRQARRSRARASVGPSERRSASQGGSSRQAARERKAAPYRRRGSRGPLRSDTTFSALRAPTRAASSRASWPASLARPSRIACSRACARAVKTASSSGPSARRDRGRSGGSLGQVGPECPVSSRICPPSRVQFPLGSQIKRGISCKSRCRVIVHVSDAAQWGERRTETCGELLSLLDVALRRLEVPVTSSHGTASGASPCAPIHVSPVLVS
jgi:hypothetical protein